MNNETIKHMCGCINPFIRDATRSTHSYFYLSSLMQHEHHVIILRTVGNIKATIKAEGSTSLFLFFCACFEVLERQRNKRFQWRVWSLAEKTLMFGSRVSNKASDRIINAMFAIFCRCYTVKGEETKGENLFYCRGRRKWEVGYLIKRDYNPFYTSTNQLAL